MTKQIENVDGERSHFNIDYCNENIKRYIINSLMKRYSGTMKNKRGQTAVLTTITRRYGTQSRKNRSMS